MSAERGLGRAPQSELGRSVVLAVVALVVAFLLWTLRSIVTVVAFAVLLAYVLDPLVSWLERRQLPRGRRMPRPAAAGIVVLLLMAVLVVTMVVAVPRVMEQTVSLARDLPASFQTSMDQLRAWARANGLASGRTTFVDALESQARAALPGLGSWFIGWLGRAFGNVFQMVGILVLPLLAFYLLAEREEVKKSVMRMLPLEDDPRMQRAGQAVDRALTSYVRGQALVCVFSGAATGGLLSLIGFPHALLLSVITAIAEVLPVVGFFFVALGIVLDGLGLGLRPTLLGLAAYFVVNTFNSTFVMPRVMGRYLKMHPFVVTVSVLAGAELLGPAGVLLALPLAAVGQALAEEFAPRRIEPPPAGTVIS